MKCPHSEICGVCSWINLPLEEQKQRKLQSLKQSLEAAGIQIPETISLTLPSESHIRDRVDLIFSKGHYGFYKKSEKDIFPIEECPQMSSELYSFFTELKKIPIPIKKGSLRLRIAPPDLQTAPVASSLAKPSKGLWLDFANTDVQLLFEEKKTLHQLTELAFVEIGQRK